jgi:tryptophanyl-tRNA synthetase
MPYSETPDNRNPGNGETGAAVPGSSAVKSAAPGPGAGPGARRRVLSGMRPTGRLHLGNLVGALQNWVKLQHEYQSYHFVADWHMLTTDYAETGELQNNIREMVTDWLAAGLDPAKATFFVQSRLPEHAELHLLFSMVTPLGWLERVPSYKEQLENMPGRDLHTYGFLGYPLLQAADILMYKANYVPVGEDQAPHVELTREVARRFNNFYGDLFPEPETLLTQTPRLRGTDGRKMSKSYNNAIYLSDPPEVVEKKAAGMMTDPARKRRYDPGDPEECPVFDHHKVFSSGEIITRVNRECRTAEIGCVDCKKLMAAQLNQKLAPILQRRKVYEANPRRVWDILEEGTERARMVARATMNEVRQAVNLIPQAEAQRNSCSEPESSKSPDRRPRGTSNA